jgi:hypothetical protein
VALDSRGLTLRGITTDGSELYPQPIFEVFGAVEHQVCRFNILAELNKLAGGVVTFGTSPPPVSLYEGPTGRRTLRGMAETPGYRPELAALSSVPCGPIGKGSR